MKTTTIELDHGTTKVQTKAYVFGEWAAHPGPPKNGSGWQITHVPSGHAVGTSQALDVFSAVDVARTLNERIPTLRLVAIENRGPRDPRFTPNESDANVVVSTFAEVLGR